MRRLAALAAVLSLAAAPALAGEAYNVWEGDKWDGGGCHDACGDYHHLHYDHELNGKLTLGGFTGGVGAGNRAWAAGYGYGGGGYGYGYGEDIAFRRARDASMWWSGPQSDRSFRFWANSIQSRRAN